MEKNVYKTGSSHARCTRLEVNGHKIPTGVKM